MRFGERTSSARGPAKQVKLGCIRGLTAIDQVSLVSSWLVDKYSGRRPKATPSALAALIFAMSPCTRALRFTTLPPLGMQPPQVVDPL